MYAALTVRVHPAPGRPEEELYASEVTMRTDGHAIVLLDDPEDEGSTAVDMGTRTIAPPFTVTANW